MYNAPSMIVVAFVLSFLTACGPDVELIDEPGLIVLEGGTLIDGTGSSAKDDTVVLIKDTEILRVAGPGEYRFGDDVNVRDARGKWIVPGFIDVHTHMPPERDQAEFLATLLAFGITTVRNPAATADQGVKLRDRIADGQVLGPRLYSAGVLIDGVGSYWDWAAEVEDVEQIRQEVREQRSQGVDYIKLYVGLTPDLVSAAIAEAHGQGLKVIGHLGRTTWTEAAEAGIDALAHSWFAGLAHSIVPESSREEFKEFYMPNPKFDPGLFPRWREVVDLTGPEMNRLAEALLKNEVCVDPNLVLGEAVCWGDDPKVLERLEPGYALPAEQESWIGKRHPYSATWSEEALAEAKATFPLFQEAIRVLHERGVVLAAGTDLRNPWMTPGVSFHRELELLADSGIPNMDVLTIATRNGAQMLGILDQTGTVEEGKRADLVILSADPVANIGNTRKIESVFMSGKEFEPALLLQRH